jgi:glycosyltransferase involved in cell wall biosynthesis
MTGKRTPELERKFEDPNLRARVRHLGFVSQGDYLRAVTCVDFFVVPFLDKPANWGRWPGRINDYFTFGKPIVTNPVGEMKELLTNHSVGLLAEEAPEDMANKICRLIDDKELRTKMGANARQLAISEVSWPVITERLDSAYHYAEKAHAIKNNDPTHG